MGTPSRTSVPSETVRASSDRSAKNGSSSIRHFSTGVRPGVRRRVEAPIFSEAPR